MIKTLLNITIITLLVASSTPDLYARNYYIDDISTHGNGSLESPFSDFSRLLSTFAPGDTLFFMPGTYNITEPIRFRVNGTKENPIVFIALDHDNRPVINNMNNGTQVFRIDTDYQVYDGFIINGNYCESQLITIVECDGVAIRNSIVRRCKRDGIMIRNSNYSEVSGCEIYYCLNDDFASQTDAHGVMASHVRNLTVKNCNIHHVSGDCFQVDPDYSPPLWDSVFIESCVFWTDYLTQDEGEFRAGEKPGENALDTKTDYRQDFDTYRPTIIIKNVEAYGFMNGRDQIYITGRAAFNIKHNVNAILINCVVHDNEIGFRLRGPYTDGNGINWGGAHATLINCIAYDNQKSVWFERSVEKARIYNSTFAKLDSVYCFWNATSGEYKCDPAVHFHYDFGGYDPEGLEILNCLFLDTKPPEASDASNFAVSASDFRNLDLKEFYQSAGNPGIDNGIWLDFVPYDISGYPREPDAMDAGAYEYRGPLDNNPTPVLLNWPAPEDNILQRYYPAYPNPAYNTITLKLPPDIPAQTKTINIYTMGGVKVFSSPAESLLSGSNPYSINISHLGKGFYILYIVMANKLPPVVVKFIKL